MRTSKTPTQQAGFSLVELMVVVAIIGILATVAIPNLQKFQNKARQTEAKAALSAIYTFNENFRTEWVSYHNCFECIGYAPAGKFIYNFGWNQAVVAGIPGYTNPGTVNHELKDMGGYIKQFVDGQVALAAAETSAPQSGGIMSTYTTCAKANLKAIDTWCMDNFKVMSNVSDGT